VTTQECPADVEDIGLYVAFALALLVVSTIGGLIVVGAVLVRLPPDYFSNDSPRPFWMDRHPIIRVIGLVTKNVIGGTLAVFGVLLSIPGVPGPGILTLLIGIMLLDFPGKRRVERWLIRRSIILRTVNWLRARYARPPFSIPDHGD
jgi:hypothetical protein